MNYLGTICWSLLLLAGLTLPSAIMMYNMRDTRHLATVKEGVLYRSGQPTVAGLRRIHHDHHIRTVVCLRDESSTTLAEQEWCEKNEVRFVRISPRNWNGLPGHADVDGPLRQFLEVMKDPANHPVLVHCLAGTHRTGGYVAVWRIEQGWTNADAIDELRGMGYETFDTDLDINEYLHIYRKGDLGRTADAGR
jgi:tyrosine-protein phosphatase SIW14